MTSTEARGVHPSVRVRRPSPRALLALPAGLCLLVGLDAGLTLLGAWSPTGDPRAEQTHGVLMVLGFVGALIALERAVALRRGVALLSPVALASGALAHLTTPTTAVGQLLLIAGAAGLVAVYVPLWRRQRDDAVLAQALGAVLATGAAVMWRGGVDMAALVPWLTGFLVLTIAGERLELARLRMRPRAVPLLLAGAGALCLAVAASLLWPAVGAPLLGLALLGIAAWLATHDVARHTVQATGLPRYMALAMLAGQVWLAVAGVVWVVGGPSGDAGYDAVVHAVFLGFTMSMVMAHAPVILPAVAGTPLPYHPVMHVPLWTLHVSLVLRLWVGDALAQDWARQAGGVLNVAALLVFVVVVVGCAVLGGRSPR